MARAAGANELASQGQRKAKSSGNRALRVLFKNPVAVASAIVLAVLVCAAIGAPWLAPYEPNRPSLGERLQPPSSEHLFGTDHYGRDVLSRTIWGARTSLLVGVGAVSLGAIVGVLLGLVAGFFGGRVDSLIARIIDMLLAFPLLLLALCLVAVLGTSIWNVIVAAGVSTVPQFARVVRGSVMSIRELDYVNASRALGALRWRTMFKHVLPNAAAPIIVMSTLYMATVVILEANLGFLGFGIQPPDPSWGSIVNDGRGYLQSAIWVSVFPSVVITLTVLALNLLGDGLRDALDPKIRGT